MARDLSKEMALSVSAMILLEQIRNMLHNNRSINEEMIDYMEKVLDETKSREIEKQNEIAKGFMVNAIHH